MSRSVHGKVDGPIGSGSIGRVGWVMARKGQWHVETSECGETSGRYSAGEALGQSQSGRARFGPIKLTDRRDNEVVSSRSHDTLTSRSHARVVGVAAMRGRHARRHRAV